MAFGTTTSTYEMDGVGAAPAVNNAADQIAQIGRASCRERE